MDAERYYRYWEYTKFKSSRDFVFQFIINGFGNRSIKVLEIGGLRATFPHAQGRYSDGWATMFWCDYVLQHGGSVTTVDIDPDVLACTARMTAYFADRVDIRLVQMLGVDFLKLDNRFDLIYLDGSIDPNEMMEEFKLCSRESVILCDDWMIKGEILEKEHPDFSVLQFQKGHVMSVYFFDGRRDRILVPEPDDCLTWQNWCWLDTFDMPKA